MDFKHAQLALVRMLEHLPDYARRNLQELNTDNLDELTDALDNLAAMVDEEASERQRDSE